MAASPGGHFENWTPVQHYITKHRMLKFMLFYAKFNFILIIILYWKVLLTLKVQSMCDVKLTDKNKTWDLFFFIGQITCG